MEATITNSEPLTLRQRECLRAAVHLQTENDGAPIHYSELAERLNISTITAYNMLKRLETKGCVRARCNLPKLRVGRSTVAFEMTPKGREISATIHST